jgi:hypothetical protein
VDYYKGEENMASNWPQEMIRKPSESQIR